MNLNFMQETANLRDLLVKIWESPWWTHFIILFYGLIATAIVALVALLVFLKIAAIWLVFLDAVWIPSWERVATWRLRIAGYSRDQMEAINRGADPGPPETRGTANIQRILDQRDIEAALRHIEKERKTR